MGRGTCRSSGRRGFGSAAVAAGRAACEGTPVVAAAADCSNRRLLIKERTFVIRLGLGRALDLTDYDHKGTVNRFNLAYKLENDPLHCKIKIIIT